MELDERTVPPVVEGEYGAGDENDRLAPEPGPEPAAAPVPQEKDLTCPECLAEGIEKHFTGPRAEQGMARHRSQIHGIKSKTQLLIEQRAAAKGKKPTTARKPPRAKNKPRAVKPPLNEKALLKMIFPLGIPLDSEVLSVTNEWIEVAKELYDAK